MSTDANLLDDEDGGDTNHDERHGNGGMTAVIETAQAAADPSLLMEGERYAAVVPAGGRLAVLDNDLDEFRQRPRRKKGTLRVRDGASFLAYLDKHGQDCTEVWADPSTSSLVGVVNAHASAFQGELRTGEFEDEGDAGWGDHRVVLDLAPTNAWQAWLLHDGNMLEQEKFAEHVEARQVDIVRPSSAEMLEVAMSLHATVKANFESAKRLSDGQSVLLYAETVTGRAGHKGQLEIPASFTVRLAPFEGAAEEEVTARFRWRLNSGDLRIGYILDRPDLVLRRAFDGIVEAVRSGTEHPVYVGPGSAREGLGIRLGGGVHPR